MQHQHLQPPLIEENIAFKQLFQRMSLTLMRGNAALMMSRRPDSDLAAPEIDGVQWFSVLQYFLCNKYSSLTFTHIFTIFPNLHKKLQGLRHDFQTSKRAKDNRGREEDYWPYWSVPGEPVPSLEALWHVAEKEQEFGGLSKKSDLQDFGTMIKQETNYDGQFSHIFTFNHHCVFKS